jgi:hypothetical protein
VQRNWQVEQSRTSGGYNTQQLALGFLPVIIKNIMDVEIVKNSMFWGCSKMFRCKARKKPNREAYMDIR